MAEARATAVMTHAAGIEELEDKQEYLCTDNQWLTSEVERLTQELAEARATAWDEGTRVTFAYLTHGASWTVNPYRAATPAREEPK